MSDTQQPPAAPSPSQVAFAGSRQDFEAKPPNFAPRHQDECARMSGADGLRCIDRAQTEGHVVETVPMNDEDAKRHRFFWVVAQETVPYALEDCVFGHGLRGWRTDGSSTRT